MRAASPTRPNSRGGSTRSAGCGSRPTAGSLAAHPPYRGLQPFGRDDAGSFFGRDEIVGQALARIEAVRTQPGGGAPVVAVVGASGSGKSSLLQAGVVPRFEAEHGAGSTATIYPGHTPALPTPLPRLLVIDQFEEVFTSVGSAARTGLLTALAAVRPGECVVVLGLRADFYSAVLAEPTLVAVLQHAQVVVTPLTREELTAAIVEPARRADVRVDAALVERVLHDLGPTGAPSVAHDPGRCR